MNGHDDEVLERAHAHHRAGRLADAAALCEQVLAGGAPHPGALCLLGTIAHQAGRHERAVELLRRSVALEPDQPAAFNVIALALASLGDADGAAASLERAIALDPSPRLFMNLGALRRRQGRTADAARAYDQAAAGLEQALRLQPTDADLWCELGDARQAAGRPDEAMAAYRDAVRCDPALARGWYAAGCVEKARAEYAAAVGYFRRALAIAPGWMEARHNLGAVLFELGQVNEAVTQFRAAAAAGASEMPSAMLAVIIPGSSIADNQAVLDARRSWRALAGPGVAPSRPRAAPRPVRDRPLRVGYVSSFFHRPNWMKPVWGLINAHDRAAVHPHLFSDAPRTAVGVGYAPQPADAFHDISGLSNEDVAALIERSGIDVLVDLNGYSRLPRLGLFALRPAPVIVGWFNMYATTGMACFDYLVGDPVVIPPNEEVLYVERIARVPGCYLTFSVDYPVPPVAESPWASSGVFTFGCLASQYKITGEVVEAWSRILAQAPYSRMIVRNGGLGSAGTRMFVHDLFAGHGIAAERVRLEGPAEHDAFLRTYDAVDVALDTFPYNGGTTTTEAIWQGVPVVACAGDRWVGRTSATILRAGELGDFVTRDVDGYVALAVELATSMAARERLVALRREMRARLLASTVCDTRAFAREMERLYRAMLEERV